MRIAINIFRKKSEVSVCLCNRPLCLTSVRPIFVPIQVTSQKQALSSYKVISNSLPSSFEFLSFFTSFSFLSSLWGSTISPSRPSMVVRSQHHWNLVHIVFMSGKLGNTWQGNWELIKDVRAQNVPRTDFFKTDCR